MSKKIIPFKIEETNYSFSKNQKGIESETKVTSYSEATTKLHAWLTGSNSKS